MTIVLFVHSYYLDVSLSLYAQHLNLFSLLILGVECGANIRYFEIGGHSWQ